MTYSRVASHFVFAIFIRLDVTGHAERQQLINTGGLKTGGHVK